ncbi:putative tRNA sulfurtransferase [Bienertia sinuspersici]
MRALAWNGRGSNSEDSITMPFVRWLVRKAYPDFVFLSEIKCSASFLSSNIIKLGPKGMAVKTEECTKNFVLCNIIDGPYFYYLCFLYGAPRLENRDELREVLNEKLAKYQGPIIILGDFNQVEFADEKSGGFNYLPGATKFTKWRVGNGLIELPSHGPAFTWCNNREGGDVIYEQLDLAYCNEQWRSMFPEALIVNQEILALDQRAILLETSLRKTKRKRPYKIEAWCLDDPQIKDIIRKNSDSLATSLLRSLVHCKLLSKRNNVEERRSSKDRSVRKKRNHNTCTGNKGPKLLGTNLETYV